MSYCIVDNKDEQTFSVIDNEDNKCIAIFNDKMFADDYVRYLRLMKDHTCLTLSDASAKWMKNHSKKCKSHGTAGEHFKIEFLPTGLGMFETIHCLICNKTFEHDDL